MDIYIILLLIGGIVLTIGDIVMKKWVINNSNLFYFLGIVTYLIGLNFLAQSFKYKNIAISSLILAIFNITVLLIVSWVFFKETLSPLQIVGIIIGITAVVILEIA